MTAMSNCPGWPRSETWFYFRRK